MKDRQRIISLYVKQEEFAQGNVDVTEKLYQIVEEAKVETIKYMMPSATETGVYFTIVIVEKTENAKSGMGFLP